MATYGTPATTSNSRPYQGFPYTNPTITDVPSINRTDDQWTNLPRKPINPPNLNITIPPNRQENNDCDTPDYVRDTILYNPFEDRRINIDTPSPVPSNNNNNQNNTNLERTASVASDTSSEDNAPRIYIPAGPRDELNGNSSAPNHNTTLPSFMSKEASIYQPNRNDDGFLLSPIPVSEFPEPPPAYSEIDRVGQRREQNETSAMNVAEQPPRTQVVLPNRVGDAAAAFNADRKNLKCPHCDRQVDTVVYRQSGIATHVAAFILFFIFFPITIFIYCTDYCKYKNHYCPDCGMLVGYEIPMTCQDFVFAEKKPA